MLDLFRAGAVVGFMVVIGPRSHWHSDSVQGRAEDRVQPRQGADARNLDFLGKWGAKLDGIWPPDQVSERGGRGVSLRRKVHSVLIYVVSGPASIRLGNYYSTS